MCLTSRYRSENIYDNGFKGNVVTQRSIFMEVASMTVAVCAIFQPICSRFSIEKFKKLQTNVLVNHDLLDLMGKTCKCESSDSAPLDSILLSNRF